MHATRGQCRRYFPASLLKKSTSHMYIQHVVSHIHIASDVDQLTTTKCILSRRKNNPVIEPITPAVPCISEACAKRRSQPCGSVLTFSGSNLNSSRKLRSSGTCPPRPARRALKQRCNILYTKLLPSGTCSPKRQQWSVTSEALTTTAC